jgi:hypothetical protein
MIIERATKATIDSNKGTINNGDTLSPLKKRGSFRGYAVRNRIR